MALVSLILSLGSFIFVFFTRPFDQEIGFSLTYFFYLYTIVLQKCMVLFRIFFLCAQPLDQKLGTSLIYAICTRPFDRNIKSSSFLSFLHDQSTKKRVLIDLFFYLYTTFWQKYVVLFNFFFPCAQPFDQKFCSSLICFFYLHTTIWPKCMVLFHLNSFFCKLLFHQNKCSLSFILSFEHNHSTKN